jgi:Secretion system C-terminal sorting domain
MKKSVPLYKLILSFTKLVFLFILTFYAVPFQAQSWQWLQAGGNDYSFNQSSETIQFIDSDPSGNVYAAFEQVTNTAIPSPFTIGNYQVPHYSGSDGILASFSCEGTLRWTIAIGGAYVIGASQHLVQIKSLKVDAQGNVYVTGQASRGSIPSQPLYFSPTFSVPASAVLNEFKEDFFIAKYNTNGVVQWVRFPQGANVITDNYEGNAYARKMDVDPNGTVHVDAVFYPGTFCDGAVTITGNQTTLYRGILKYDTNGAFIGYVAIEYSDDGDVLRTIFKHDPHTGKYYIAKINSNVDMVPTYIGGQLQIKKNYVASFNSNGVFIWKQEDNNIDSPTYFSDLMGLSIDNESNIYFNCALGFIDFAQGILNSWNGQELLPIPTENAGHLGVVIKMDSNGNTIWIKNNTNSNGGPGLGRSVINGNELAIATAAPRLAWDGLPLVEIPAITTNHSVFRINKNTGTAIGLDNLNLGGYLFSPTAIAAGANGSYYLGGGFNSTITGSGLPATSNTGGFDDFYIAKLGTNNCTLATTPTTTASINLQVHPVPTSSLLYINNKEAIDYIIYDALGKMVQMNSVDPDGSIDLQYLTKGIYLLQMKDGNGNITTQKIIKE